jgi:hypothetical protein
MDDSFELRGDTEGSICGLDGVCQAFNRTTLPRLEEQRPTPVERQLGKQADVELASTEIQSGVQH